MKVYNRLRTWIKERIEVQKGGAWFDESDIGDGCTIDLYARAKSHHPGFRDIAPMPWDETGKLPTGETPVANKVVDMHPTLTFEEEPDDAA